MSPTARRHSAKHGRAQTIRPAPTIRAQAETVAGLLVALHERGADRLRGANLCQQHSAGMQTRQQRSVQTLRLQVVAVAEMRSRLALRFL